MDSKILDKEGLFKQLFEHSGTCNSYFDTSGVLIANNQNFADLFGERSESMRTSSSLEITNQSVYNLMQQRIVATIKENKVKTYYSEFYNIGKLYSMESIYVPVLDENGKVKGVHVISRDISELKQEEIALKKSKEGYKALFEQSTLGVLIANVDKQITLVNKRITDISGYREEDILGKSLDIFFDRKTLEQIPYRIDLIEKGETVISERKLTKKDGTSCFVEMRSKKMTDGRYQTLIVDISLRKKWEMDLKESEERYRGLYEMLSDPVFLIEKETGNILEVNSVVEKVYGISRKESLKMKNIDFSAEPDASQKALQDKATKVLLRWHKKKNGKVFPVEITESNFNWNGKEVQIAVCRDISDRIEAEKSLKEFERIFNLSPNPISISNMEGNFVKVNPAFEKILGFTYGEMENRSVFDFIHPEDREPTLKYITEKIQAHSKLLEFENRYLTKQGEVVWFSWKTMAVFEEGIAFSVAHDITGLKKIEQELIKAKGKAEESDRLKTAFLCNMSHEIRTPMNGIVGFVDILSQPDIDGEKRAHITDIINQSCQRLLNIINDIIDISKIETGQLSYDITSFDICEILNTTFEFYKSQVDKKGIELSIDCRVDRPLMIRADKIKVRQVFDNLITNALKFTRSGTIELSCFLKGEYVCCAVSDTGDGIPEEFSKGIFERFIQVDNDLERKSSGTGLGLPICKAFVEAMGGDMWVETEVGKGSVFKFTLQRPAQT